MVKRKFLVVINILLASVLLSGCWDASESDKMVYAQGIGVDYKGGKYTLYVQLMNLSMLAKSESGGGSDEEMQSEIGQASGFSLEDALFNLYRTSQRRIHWGHLNYIFLTQNTIKNNVLQDVTDILDRFFETHYRIWLYSTNEPLAEIMTTQPPIKMSTYLSRLGDPEATFEQASNIPPFDLREVVISYYEPPHEIIIPHVSLNENNWKSDQKPRKIGAINGISIIADNTLKGNIMNEAANGYRWMEKKFKRMGLSLKTGENDTVGLTISKKKVHIEPIVRNGKVQFDIHLEAIAAINKLNNDISTSKISSEAEKLIKKEIEDTFTGALEFDSDVYRLTEILYRKDFIAWKKVQKEGRIPLDKATIRKIDVNVEIKDSGNQRKVPTLKKDER